MTDPNNPFGLSEHSQKKVNSYWREFKRQNRTIRKVKTYTKPPMRRVGRGCKWDWETDSRTCKGHYDKANQFCTDVCACQDMC